MDLTWSFILVQFSGCVWSQMSGFGCSDGRSKSHAKPPIELKTRFKNRIFQRILFELVLIAMRVHLFPSRTQKLSSSAPTILAGWLAGKIGNANIKLWSKGQSFFVLCRLKPAGGRFLYGGTTLALAGKIANANIRPAQSGRSFLLCFDLFLTRVLCRLKPATGRFLHGGTILARAGKIANANKASDREIGGFL